MKVAIEKYLNIRMAYAPSFSPDGSRMAFLTNITGVPQVWSVDIQGGWPDQLTFHKERVSGVWYSPTDDRLIFARDVGGDENTQLYRIDENHEERQLTHDPKAMHIFGGWSPDGKRIVFSANRRDRGRYDVYVQAVDGGEAEMVWQNNTAGIVIPTSFSPDSARVLVHFVHSHLNHDLYEVQISQHAIRHLTPHHGNVRHGSPAYSADAQSVYCLCDLDREFAGLMKLDLSNLALHAVAQPTAEIEMLAASRDGRYLAWVVNQEGEHQIIVRDLSSGNERKASGLPVGVVSPMPDNSGMVFSASGNQLAFSFSSSRRTHDIWLWDLVSNRLVPITKSSHGGIATSAFVEPKLVHYPTFDERLIPAWYYCPLTKEEPRPVIVYVHGGPEGQARPMLIPILQYFIARGYAVLAPNVRGSTGYGKTYTQLDDVEKRMNSVADLAHGVKWLSKQSDIDPKRIAIYGGSYGGFMVLAALTTYPDLWAAGVDIVGISNFVTFLENTSPYRRSVREVEYGSLERDHEFLKSISPIHHVDKIRAPLMVVHGANDPRVPLGEAEQIAKAVRARNVPVEFLVYQDEGHGLVKLVNKLDAYPKVVDFLDRNLKA